MGDGVLGHTGALPGEEVILGGFLEEGMLL